MFHKQFYSVLLSPPAFFALSFDFLLFAVLFVARRDIRDFACGFCVFPSGDKSVGPIWLIQNEFK